MSAREQAGRDEPTDVTPCKACGTRVFTRLVGVDGVNSVPLVLDAGVRSELLFVAGELEPLTEPFENPYYRRGIMAPWVTKATLRGFRAHICVPDAARCAPS